MRKLFRAIKGLGPFLRRDSNSHQQQFSSKQLCPDLPPELTAPTRLERSLSIQPEGEIAAAFAGAPGAHKWLHYFSIYESLFAPLRERPISVLEMGVYQGASLKVWRDYFHPQSIITGIDINPDCARFDDPSRNVFVRIGPQQDSAFLNGVVSDLGPFDLIIDDGSHVASHLIASFCLLFGRGLKEGGLYFVEDTHTSFWPEYRDTEKSFLDFCYDLVEYLHFHYRLAISERRYRVGGSDSLPWIEVPKITAWLEEIRFFDSVVAIRKSKIPRLPQSRHW